MNVGRGKEHNLVRPTGVHGHVKLEVAFLAELGLTHRTLPGLHVRVGQQVSHQKPPPLEPLPTNLTYKRLLTCRKIWKQVLWNVGQLVPLITDYHAIFDMGGKLK